VSTLLEIEAALKKLPAEEQRSLLAKLSAQLETASRESSENRADHRDWMKRLERMRNSLGTGIRATTTEEIIDDLRS
jgi:hypothetical protein